MPSADFVRADWEVMRELAVLGTATVYEAAGQQGQMDPAIRPLLAGVTLFGPALTVECHPADNLMIHLAVAIAHPGDVLVVNAGGYLRAGAWGEILTVAAQARGVAGLVIDGAVRDVRRIREMGFPVFARGVSLGATTKQAPGRLAVPVVCAGVLVRPGDIVLGDDDGVVVVDREQAEAVLRAARRRAEREQAIILALNQGATTLDLLELRPVLRRLGITEEGRDHEPMA